MHAFAYSKYTKLKYTYLKVCYNNYYCNENIKLSLLMLLNQENIIDTPDVRLSMINSHNFHSITFIIFQPSHRLKETDRKYPLQRYLNKSKWQNYRY